MWSFSDRCFDVLGWVQEKRILRNISRKMQFNIHFFTSEKSLILVNLPSMQYISVIVIGN